MLQEMLREGMLIQGNDVVMVPAGQVPVLVVAATDALNPEWTEKLVMAINFLNCGCPSVTIRARSLDTMKLIQRRGVIEVLQRELRNLMPEYPKRYEIEETGDLEAPFSVTGTLTVQYRSVDHNDLTELPSRDEVELDNATEMPKNLLADIQELAARGKAVLDGIHETPGFVQGDPERLLGKILDDIHTTASDALKSS